MNCAGFRDALMDVIDGTLSPAAHELAHLHEKSCSDCAGLARTVREQSALLSRLARPTPPSDLGMRIERALGARGAVVRPRRWRAWAAAAAAALVAAAGLLGSPRAPDAERSVEVVDVVLPDRGSFLGRISPSVDNPGAGLLDPLILVENP
jgi:predicted anti-sigma-YlaC factor YlaD